MQCRFVDYEPRGSLLPISLCIYLGSIHLHSVLNGLVGLLHDPFSCRLSEHHLGLQAPFLRDVPFLGRRGIHHWIIMLQINPETLRGQHCPHSELQHPAGMLRPYSTDVRTLLYSILRKHVVHSIGGCQRCCSHWGILSFTMGIFSSVFLSAVPSS